MKRITDALSFRKILMLAFFLPFTNSVFAQTPPACLVGGCSNTVTPYPSYTLNATSDWAPVGSFFTGGEYATFNVVGGNTYQWSTCSEFGGYQSANTSYPYNKFDAELTLFDQNWNKLCFNSSSGLPRCPNAAFMGWTAPAGYNGVVYVLVSDEYFGQCQSTSNAYAVLVWRQSAGGGGSCGWTASPSSQTLSGVAQYSSFTAVLQSGSCSPQVVSNDPSWITITGVTNGTTVNYYVSQNNTGGQRTGTISLVYNGSTLATYTVYQSAATSITSDFIYYPPSYVNSPVYFYDRSTGNPSPNDWAWSFGDGFTSTQTNPQHTYTSTGAYIVSLTVKNSNNNSNTSSQTVNIMTPPPAIADFYSDRNNIKPGTSVNFTDNSTNGPSSWQWSFPGGAPGSYTGQAPPPILYNTPGTYRVTLTVANSNPPSSTKEVSGYITVSPDGTNQLIPPPLNAVNGQGHQYIYAEPIQIGTSTYAYKHADFTIPVVNGSINFIRFYNSLNAPVDGQLGFGWSHSYNYYVDNQQDTLWNVHYPDGHIATFVPLYNGGGQAFPLYSGTLDSLQKNNGGDFTLFIRDNHQYHFNTSGQLDKIIDLNGNTTTLIYNGSNLVNIVGQGGRSLALSYGGNNKIATINDPLGRTVSFGYDNTGNLQTVTDAKHASTGFTYDAGHHITAVVNGLGDTILKNEYDLQNRLVTQKDAYNQATTISYNSPSAGDAVITNPDATQIFVHHDSFYRKTFVKDELGFTNNYTYDNRNNEISFVNENNVIESKQYDWLGNITNKTVGANKSTQVAYNKFGSPVEMTDPNGNTTTFSYDANNNLTSVHFPDNTIQNIDNNTDGTRSRFTDGRNSSTTYTYNNSGDLVASSAPNGTKYYEHDAAGRIISTTDENGNKSFITYDDNDNIVSIKNALAQVLSFEYDANNQIVLQRDKKGFITAFTYDKKGRLSTKVNARGGVTTYAYDKRDNVIAITDPGKNKVNFSYDKKGRKKSRTDALGTTFYSYDGLGNVIKVTDATGNSTTYTYTATNKIETIKDGLNNYTNFTYDKNDNLASVINALNKTTAYTYDAMNRLTQVLDAENNSTVVTYDENGNRKTVTDPNGHKQTYTYDEANRLILFTDAANNSIAYNYDPVGNNLSITKPTGAIYKSYDIGNRVRSIVNPDGNNYYFDYDDNNNLTLVQNNTGKTVMEYDSLNRLISYTDAYAKTVGFGYDAMGNKTSITYPGNNKVIYGYDGANNLTSVKDWFNRTFTYMYDAAGKNTRLTYPNGSHCDYGFDNANRLTSKKNITATNGIINSSQFLLDEIGNKKTEQRQGPIPSYLLPGGNTYNYTDDDGMTTNAVWNYANDGGGNRILETKGALKTSYNFSVDNLLNSMTDSAGIVTSFAYDALGHRLSKQTNTLQRNYVLDVSTGLSQVLQITDEKGIVNSQYVYGLGLLERIDASNNALYYHFDAQHNTVALTDQFDSIKDTYTYDPFGTLLSHTGSTDQPFMFLGEYGVEQESAKLFYARARYYDASNGRFLSKDDYPFDINNPQTINRYVYGTNNPLSLFDYTGLWPNWSTLGQSLKDLGSLVLNFGLGVGEEVLGAAQIVTGDEPGGVSSAYSGLQSINNAARYSVGFFGNLYYGLIGNGTIPDSWYEGPLDAYNASPIGQTVNTINDIFSLYSLGSNINGAFNGSYELLSSNIFDNYLPFAMNNIGNLILLDGLQLFEDFVKSPIDSWHFLNDTGNNLSSLLINYYNKAAMCPH